MGAPDVLARLSALGVSLTREGDSLIARPRSAMTDEARAMIRSNKAALLEALARPAAATPAAHSGAAVGQHAEPQDERDGACTGSEPSPGFQARRQRLLAMLADVQAVRYAVLTDTETDPEAVILALAIRGLMPDGAAVTCELRVPREKFDPFLLMDLIARHGAMVH